MRKYKNFVLTTVGEGSDLYRVFVNNSGMEFDIGALGTIVNNRVSGLVPFVCRGNEIGYNIRGLVSLRDIIKEVEQCQAKSAIYKIIGNLGYIAANLEQFGLNADKLIFDIDDIYVDRNTMNVYMLYYPLINLEKDDVRDSINNILDICNALVGNKDVIKAETPDSFIKEDKLDEAELEKELQRELAEEVQVELAEEKIQEELAQEVQTEFINYPKETVVFNELQNDVAHGVNNISLNSNNASAYIVRRSTGEITAINRNIFKMGKDEQYVDYFIYGNSAISRSHADIIAKEDGYYIEDNASLNHTYLNGRMLIPHQQVKIENGAVIQLADEYFDFKL